MHVGPAVRGVCRDPNFSSFRSVFICVHLWLLLCLLLSCAKRACSRRERRDDTAVSETKNITVAVVQCGVPAGVTAREQFERLAPMVREAAMCSQRKGGVH